MTLGLEPLFFGLSSDPIRHDRFQRLVNRDNRGQFDRYRDG